MNSLFFSTNHQIIIIILLYTKLTSAELISVFSILNALTYPLYRVPVFITGVLDAIISNRRIIDFLNWEEDEEIGEIGEEKESRESIEAVIEGIEVNKHICILEDS